MYEIWVTLHGEMKPDEFFKIILEVAENQKNDIFVDPSFSFNFAEFQFLFMLEEYKSRGNRLYFSLPNNLDISDIAESYGRFVTLLLKSTIGFNISGDVISEREVDLKKGDKIAHLSDFVDAIWIKKVR